MLTPEENKDYWDTAGNNYNKAQWETLREKMKNKNYLQWKVYSDGRGGVYENLTILNDKP